MVTGTDTILGRQVHLTLEQCPLDILDDPGWVEEVTREACDRLNVSILNTTVQRFEPYGLSIVTLLAESHLAIHTWPEHGVATIDIFTCGDTDPLEIVPFLTNALRARVHKCEQDERAPVHMSGGITRYPGFDEYILRPVPGAWKFPTPKFRRGIGREYLLEPEGVAWQDYFCSPEYRPPEGRDVLLLHSCTWAKPYDFSELVARLRRVTDHYQQVHRVIVSNVGLVPYEYQANPFFCSYDYCSSDHRYSAEQCEQAVRDFRNVTRARLERFLRSRAEDYRAVVVLSRRGPHGLWRTVVDVAKTLGLPGTVGPSVATLRHVQADWRHGQDPEGLLFDERCLSDLAGILQRLTRFLEVVDA